MGNSISDGLKIIVDLSIPPSDYLKEKACYYISTSSSKLCRDRLNKFEKRYINFLNMVVLNNKKKPYNSFDQIEGFAVESFSKEDFHKFITEIRELIIYSYFSHPVVLSSLPIPINEHEIRMVIEEVTSKNNNFHPRTF